MILLLKSLYRRLLCLGLLFLSLPAQGQWDGFGVQLSYIQPSGPYYGPIFKSTPGIEVGYRHGFKGPVSTTLLLGYYAPRLRNNPFQTYSFGPLYGGSGPLVVVPESTVIDYYHVISLSGLMEWSPRKVGFSPSFGLELNFHGTRSRIREPSLTLLNGLSSIGVTPRIGCRYLLDDSMEFNLGIGKSIAMNEYEIIQTFWKVYFGVFFSP